MNDKINEIKNAVINKADEVYNKLPLDKINEKLGGKVDVKSKKFKIGVFVAIPLILILVICMIFSGGGEPGSSEISRCKTRINRFEKNYGEGRICKKISDFEEMSSITPSATIAKYTGLKAGKECDRYSCIVTWKDGKTSAAVFVRQGDKFGVFVRDWAE